MVYKDSSKSFFLWLHTHADGWFWYISPEIGSTYNGKFVARIESPQICPHDAMNWLKWKMPLLIQGKWMPEGKIATCKLDPTWSIWTSWSNCVHRDCSKTEMRRRTRTCENSPDLSCPGDNFEESKCEEDCKAVRALCCESLELETEDDRFSGRFEMEFFMLGKPVYRHVESIDTFLYNNGSHWNLGKGLLQGMVSMSSIDGEIFCPSEVENWTKESKLSCSNFKEDPDQGECCGRIFAMFQKIGRKREEKINQFYNK